MTAHDLRPCPCSSTLLNLLLELLQKAFNKTERIQEANNQDAVQWLAIEQLSAADKCGSLQAARLYAGTPHFTADS